MKCAILLRKDNNNLIIKKRYIDYFKGLNYEVDIIDIDSNLDNYDLFIIPGGDDINPNIYHEENISSYNIDIYNDELDFKVIEYALEHNKPLLGICRGIQSINVFFLGSLYQNIDNHVKNNHFIKYKNKYYLVNSYHHQGIKRLGDGIIPIAKAIDNQIEIIKYKKIIGVSFHPEMINTPIINNLIIELINEA